MKTNRKAPDSSSSSAAQRKSSDSDVVQQRPAENKTGLPDNLKQGIEHLSGYSMDDVKVHYNSNQPAQLNAHAYAQGSDIHVASGQEKHLPHEAWHVVQQKQGRVQATTQLKGMGVNTQDMLEKEADLMGAKALSSPVTKPAQLKSTAVHTSSIVQRVENKVLDSRMSELQGDTVAVLHGMEKKGENWQEQYGEKGKEKGQNMAKDKLAGKKTNYSKEFLKKALKKMWDNMSAEERAEFVLEAAKIGFKALTALVKGAVKTGSLFSRVFGGKKEEKKEKQDEKEESGGSTIVEVLSNTSQDDLNTLYNLYKAHRKVKNKIDEAKEKFVEGAGTVGQKLGETYGKYKDNKDFKKRMEDYRQPFIVLRKRLELLKETIKNEKQLGRYSNELDALDNALNTPLNGPAMIYFLGDLTEEGKEHFLFACRDASEDIIKSKSFLSRGGILETVSQGIGTLKAKVTHEDSKDEKVKTEQGLLLKELTESLGKSWSKWTSFGWTPSGVKSIQKALNKGKDTTEKLELMKTSATTSADKDSGNRSPETQIFYDALKGMNLNSVSSIQKTLSVVGEINSKLG